MALLTPVRPTLNGTVLAPSSAASGGDQFPNDGKTLYYVNNGGAGSINVTFDALKADGDLPLTDIVKAVANGTAQIFGPFPTKLFNNAQGLVSVTYSGVSSVTVKAIRLP